MTTDKIRVGLIGANVRYGWAPRAHIPALLALPDFEIAAVCTAHEATAKESAEAFGVPLAFHDHREMLSQADLDVVAVLVRVPKHHRLTMDVIEAGKHVYTEWPLGASLEEAQQMADLAAGKGVRAMVGLQGRASPAMLALRELIAEGYVGEVVSARMTQFAAGALARTSDRTWQSDRSLGATTLTISFGHAIDTLNMCLGELAEVSAVVSTQVPQWHESDTGRTVDVTAPDSILVNGKLESGAVASAHVSSIPWHGDGYRLAIYGREGTLTATADHSGQIDRVRIRGGEHGDAELSEMTVPARHTLVPASVPQGPPFNVAQMWTRFGEAIRSGGRVEPDFDMAVTRHRLLDAIQRAADTGQKQRL